MPEPCRLKGKFVKKHIFDWKKNLGLACHKRKLVNEKRKEQEFFIPVDGRRIINVEKLARDLWCYNCKDSISLRFIENESTTGLGSSFTVRCHKCSKVRKVHTNNLVNVNGDLDRSVYDVNLKAACAVIDSGNGTTQLNTMLTALNVPPTNHMIMKRCERIVGPAIESVAKESCVQSLREEKRLTEQKQLKDPNSTDPVGLTGSYDGAWPKRGNGHVYNSLSGHGSLIGKESGKIVAYATRNKDCRMCKAGRDPKDHDCRRNWAGSAKAMEPDIAVQITAKNKDFEEHNVILKTLVGDDDSSTIAAVNRENEQEVEKWSDINHATRKLSNALWAAKIHRQVIEYLKHCFTCAIKKNANDVKAIKADLSSIVPHAFDEHNNCGDWCGYKRDPLNFKHKYLPKNKCLEGEKLRATLTSIMNNFCDNAEKLAGCGSSQANESFNAIVVSKNPKSRHYGGSESYDFRVSSGVCQKNLGTKYIEKVYEKLELSPGKNCQAFREKKDEARVKKALFAQTPKFKANRQVLKNKRLQKTINAERKEGITYDSGCGLKSISNVLDLPVQRNNKESQVVLFDIEINSLSVSTAEICQIAAKCNDKEFNVYIIPKQGIPERVFKVTRLKVIDDKMFYKEEECTVCPEDVAILNFIQFLKSIGNNLILVAHNGLRYDLPILLRVICSYDLLTTFKDTVSGFADTLQIFKDMLPERKKEKLKFNQEDLVADLLEDYVFEDAHNALGDVKALSKLVEKVKVTTSCFVQKSISVNSFLRSAQMSKETKDIIKAMDCMETVSKGMRKKIAEAGISMKHLKEAFSKGGNKGVELLLGEDVGGRPRVTKTKKIITSVILEIKQSLGLPITNPNSSEE